ncbi:hypothetical protein ATK36_4296 [Amycolatopsis sulphurea]|uniref:Uncharacterized protein n=1 Tax=Amycolatopsis sulphurea TaxID=76022 RepID=A0A2A9FDZ5_9PSEU|nr:hypothetical protein [Amycolatopsis sulphurea]PFG49163.1 hypothetical protein ATK36_4296 [Amycolatopsis sulphurea]
MRITMVDSTEEYTKAVAAVLRGTATAVPVLHQSALPSPEGVVRRAQEPAAGRVVGFGNEEWAAAARLHAWLDRRGFEWFDGADALVAAAGAGRDPLTVCAPPELLTRAVQDAITAATSFRLPHAEVAEVDFPAHAVSFLTARTLPVLTRVVVAHAQYRDRRVERALGLFPERMTGVGDDDALTCLEGNALSAAAVAAADRPNLLMMWGHSREDLFNLGSDCLCGKSFESADTRVGALVPTCVTAGTCVKPGEALPINRIGVPTVVMGGCNVLRLGETGLFAPEFSLAFSAQEGGSSAVVTASGVVIGSLAEYLFLYRLLRGGLAVGEAVRLLNAAMPFLGPDSPSYQVLGEGDRVLFDPPPNRAEVRRVGDRVEFTDVSAEFLTVDLPRFDPALRVRVDGRQELYYAVVPRPDAGATAYLFGTGRLDGVDLAVTVDTRPPGGADAGAVVAAVTHLSAYGRLLRGYHAKLKSLEPEWRSTATHLLRQGAKARFDVRAGADADKRAATTAEQIHNADRVLCQHYLDRTASAKAFTFHEQCLFEDGTFSVVRHGDGGACPYCGDAMMSRLVRSDLVPEVRREVGICRTCGTIWDRPETVPAPLLTLDPVLHPTEPTPVGLELRNGLDRTMRGWAGLTVRRAKQFGYRVEQPPQRVVLEPGEARTALFTLATTAEIPTDAEFLRGYWSSELALTVAQRTIWTAVRRDQVLRPVGDLRHFGDYHP